MDRKARVLRRARGFAPSPIALPRGFEAAPPLTAFGGELKSTFCLVKNGQAILSQHQGDLENSATFDDYRNSLNLYGRMFAHRPQALVIDQHPEYLSSKFGQTEARRSGLALLQVQHHHAHIASCLAENGHPLDAPAVLGIALDGIGFGDDGSIWGGEFLLADYSGYRRVGRLRPIAMPGGAQAVREPWRNLYAHLAATIGWEAFLAQFGGLELCAYLKKKPLRALDGMMAKQMNAPLASSCGRLFDAVSAALQLCPERQDYEGEAAIRLETLAQRARSSGPRKGYDFGITAPSDDGPIEIDPTPMWNALLDDLKRSVPHAAIALRFHEGFAQALIETANRLHGAGKSKFEAVALTGGCFQNRILFETVADGLRAEGFRVLAHTEVPANDGGLSLGQAAIAVARLIKPTTARDEGRMEPCVSAFQAASSE